MKKLFTFLLFAFLMASPTSDKPELLAQPTPCKRLLLECQIGGGQEWYCVNLEWNTEVSCLCGSSYTYECEQIGG